MSDMPTEQPSYLPDPLAEGAMTGDADASVNLAQLNTRNIDFLKEVEVVATVELGSTTLPIREILKLHRGSVVELDRLVGQPVDLLVNNTLLAKGEVIVINERFGFRIMKFVNQAEEG